MNLLDRAIEIAKVCHEGQKDKIGKPYIEHPLRVMNSLTDTKSKIVGVLHDVVEDTDTELKDIEKMFGKEIADALDAISRMDGEDYINYIARVKKNDLATKVKIADLNDNLKPERLHSIQDDKTRNRLFKKYLWAITQLEE